MNTVEFIKDICKENGIPISRLERECGFSNGYIRNLREGKMPADRLQKVAQFLGVSMELLLAGERPAEYYINPETAKIAQEIMDNNDLHVLFDAAYDAEPEDLKLVYQMLMHLKSKERG